jgi:hypothetical protein
MWNVSASAMQNYTTTRQLDAMEKAAENEWTSGAMMWTVVGMNMWQTMWNAITWWNGNNNDSVEIKLEKLKNLLDKWLITQEDYEAKKKEILNSL